MLQNASQREQIERRLEQDVQKIAAADTAAKLSLLCYFNRLNKREPDNFSKQWDQVLQKSLTPHEHTKILYQTIIYLHNSAIDCDQRGAILSHIRSNIDAWQNSALQIIDQFTDKDKARALWTLAIVDSHFSEDCLKETYTALKAQTHLTEQSEARYRKQIRDADLWFTGHSNIPNPDFKQKPRPLIFENEVRSVFADAGFVVDRPSNPLIPELEQAIDFPILDPAHDSEIWVEVDGKHHFVNLRHAQSSTELEYNIQTRFRSALQRRLAESDSIILRMDIKVSNDLIRLRQSSNLTDKLESQILCTQFAQAARNAGPGIYRTTSTQPPRIEPMVRHDRNWELKMAA